MSAQTPGENSGHNTRGLNDIDLAAAGENAEGLPALLPFAFARRFSVVITGRNLGDGKADVACKAQLALPTLAEVRRLAKREIGVRVVGEEEFEQLLTDTYSRDSSEARQMVEDLGEEMDLASLANSVPETEDLNRRRRANHPVD